MRGQINILFLVLILFSCSQEKTENLIGSWRLNNNELIDTPFFPNELCFTGDTLIMVDGNNFKHQIRYQVKNDSIKMIFSNGSVEKIDFSVLSDSIISFGLGTFHKIPNELLSTALSYNLLGYKTNEILNDNVYSSVIHLVKDKGRLQVILNGVTTDLENIPFFLESSHGSHLPLILYIGKGIEFMDLVVAYLWIKLSWTHNVILVTGNNSFNKFYIIKDHINIDDLLMDKFLTKENIPPIPPRPKDTTDREIIKIKNRVELKKLLKIYDSTEYLIQVGNQLDIISYLELLERINKKKNIKKIITAYNTGE